MCQLMEAKNIQHSVHCVAPPSSCWACPAENKHRCFIPTSGWLPVSHILLSYLSISHISFNAFYRILFSLPGRPRSDAAGQWLVMLPWARCTAGSTCSIHDALLNTRWWSFAPIRVGWSHYLCHDYFPHQNWRQTRSTFLYQYCSSLQEHLQIGINKTGGKQRQDALLLQPHYRPLQAMLHGWTTSHQRLWFYLWEYLLYARHDSSSAPLSFHDEGGCRRKPDDRSGSCAGAEQHHLIIRRTYTGGTAQIKCVVCH